MTDVSDIVAGHRPPYVYEPGHGYRQEPSQHNGGPQNFSPAPADVASEDDAIYDTSEDEISETELAEANPQDFTKSYNRQRRLMDPSVPADQKPKTNVQRPKANVMAQIDDQISSLSKHAAKLKLDDVSAGMTSKGEARGEKDRADRATSEQVLDPRTRMILLQMINRGIVSEVNGCISTGKEANVYHAMRAPGPDTPNEAAGPVAIKIFKTSILTFKARSAYLEGEHRFRSGYKSKSSHAMVRMWSEKEFRNLKRLFGAGLPVPEPLYLRAHVLVMGFIGSKKGWSAPLLRDCEFAADEADTRWRSLYREVVWSMRVMYQDCRLVHADLSEYNMLFSSGKLWIIDVGQAVEHDHPRSFDFLRTDIKNITRFFAAKGVSVLSEPVVFGFVTAETGATDVHQSEAALDQLEKVSAETSSADEAVETAVFRGQYIPQTLNQVFDAERDAEKIQKGEGGDLVYQSLLAADSGAADAADTATKHGDFPDDEAADDNEDGDDDDDDDGSSASASGKEHEEKKPRGKRFEDKAAKKDHKAAVKEEKREKRKTKMSKKDKKRLMNASSRGHRK